MPTVLLASVTLLVLDESGEHLVEPGPDGWVTGRAAFYDPVWNSRWGGVVSGDQITASYTETCGWTATADPRSR